MINQIELYPHQQRVLEETKQFNRTAHYLDMGLGKTFTGSEKMKELDTKVNLVICQKSKIQDWYEHFKTYYKVWVYDMSNKNDFESFKHHMKHEPPFPLVAIINYDLVWRRPELSQLRDFTLLLDESSMIKNEKAKRTKFIMKLKSRNVILLSGTPTGGKYEELWTQANLLGWNISKNVFWSQFIKTHQIDVGGFPIKIVTGYKNVDRLKRKLRDHGAVFMKTEEVFNLPEQVDNVIKVKPIPAYNRFKKHRIVTIEDKELVGDTTLTKMLYERQLCGQYNKHKMVALRDLLESTNDRVIIFYNFNEEYERIKKLCETLDKPVSVVNGSEKNLKNYNNHSDSVTLIQYQAGAHGLNLQLANKIIYYTLPLSSEMFEQSKKRIHRIGQNKTCFYYYLIVEGSIEEKIWRTLKMRRDYTNKLFEEDE